MFTGVENSWENLDCEDYKRNKLIDQPTGHNHQVAKNQPKQSNCLINQLGYHV